MEVGRGERRVHRPWACSAVKHASPETCLAMKEGLDAGVKGVAQRANLRMGRVDENAIFPAHK